VTINQAGPLTELYVGDLWEVVFPFLSEVQATVTAGGTDQPASGTTEQLTVSTVSNWPAIVAGQSILAIDYNELGSPFGFELLAITALVNGSGQTWSVTRGANATVPTAHASPWTITPVAVAPGSPPQVAKVPTDPTDLAVKWAVTNASGVGGSTTTLTYTGATTPAPNSVWRSGPGLYRAWIDTTGQSPGTIIAEAIAPPGAAQKVAPRWATLIAAPL
jgi:hypothetical protein